MTKRIQIESTLAKIANVVFETKDFKLAQQTALDHPPARPADCSRSSDQTRSSC